MAESYQSKKTSEKVFQCAYGYGWLWTTQGEPFTEDFIKLGQSLEALNIGYEKGDKPANGFTWFNMIAIAAHLMQ